MKIEKDGITMLLEHDHSVRKLESYRKDGQQISEKQNLVRAFFLEKNIQLTIGKVSYLKAFDLVRCRKRKKPKRRVKIDFSNVEDIANKIEDITIIEVKATKEKKVDKNFSKHFFNLSVREFWLAVALKDQYRFILIHEGLGKYQELRWQDILARAKGVNLDFKITLE